jgi:FMN phosphatase YigB (HAD superfamily)
LTLPGPGEVDAFLLDFGNVVVEIDFGRVVAHWARSAGVAAEGLRARFSHDEHYRRHERDEIPAAEYFASLRASLGVELDDLQLEDGWNAVFVREIPEVVSLLPRLARRVPLYVFSNTNRAHHRHFAERYAHALSAFRGVFVSHELGARKPDPEAFRSVASAIGVPPGRILFFDDLAENVAGARAAGMPGVVVSSPNDFVRAVQPWLQ